MEFQKRRLSKHVVYNLGKNSDGKIRASNGLKKTNLSQYLNQIYTSCFVTEKLFVNKTDIGKEEITHYKNHG